MSKKIALLSKLIILILLSTASNAFDLKIVPPNKPILNKEVKESKILKNIIKPKEKPQKKVVTTESTTDEVKIAEEITKSIIIPKTKPLVVKKQIDKSKTKSKHFRQKDFILAKKAIKEMEKRQWTKALSISKKAKY